MKPLPRARQLVSLTLLLLATLGGLLVAGGGDLSAPGVASLLTGLVPSKHGVQGARKAPPLSERVGTLAERFQAAGWHTTGISGGAWV